MRELTPEYRRDPKIVSLQQAQSYQTPMSSLLGQNKHRVFPNVSPWSLSLSSEHKARELKSLLQLQDSIAAGTLTRLYLPHMPVTKPDIWGRVLPQMRSACGPPAAEQRMLLRWPRASHRWWPHGVGVRQLRDVTRVPGKLNQLVISRVSEQ